MKTLYSMPSTFTARPSRSGSPSSCSSSRKQPDSDTAVAAHASARSGRRRPIGRGSLSPGLEPASARMRPESWQRPRLETGHLHTRQRLRGRLLEHLPEPRERSLVLALHPAAGAQGLLEGVPARARLRRKAQFHSRSVTLGAQFPHRQELVTHEPARFAFFDDPARALEDGDLDLGPLLRAGVLKPEAGRRAEPYRVHAGEPELRQEVVGE